MPWNTQVGLMTAVAVASILAPCGGKSWLADSPQTAGTEQLSAYECKAEDKIARYGCCILVCFWLFFMAEVAMNTIF